MTELILGVDPGTQNTGYGVIAIKKNGFEVVDYGCIKTTPSKTLPMRHLQIYEGMQELLERYSVQAVAVETQYVHKNVASSLKLGMARAVAMLAASLRQIPVFEYAPTVAKRSVVGNGKASKEQVGKMVKLLLSLNEIPEPEDASDALAIAICHANTMRFTKCMSISAGN